MNHFAHHNSRLRRGATLFGLAAVLGLAAAGLTQCRVVNDTVTGVDIKAGTTFGSRDRCVENCKDQYKDAREAEEDRYRSARRACGSSWECRRAAREQHEENIDRIKEAKKSCKRGCYNEGGGQGGRDD